MRAVFPRLADGNVQRPYCRYFTHFTEQDSIYLGMWFKAEDLSHFNSTEHQVFRNTKSLTQFEDKYD